MGRQKEEIKELVRMIRNTPSFILPGMRLRRNVILRLSRRISPFVTDGSVEILHCRSE
jgi:hypothetical protein